MSKEVQEKPADTDPLLAGVSRAIQQRREEIGLSQEEIAHRAGLHRTYISDIERGARNPSLKTLARLPEALEVAISTLIKRGEDLMPESVRAPIRQNHDGSDLEERAKTLL
jgi:transcriptional regulator with XRE-family HTH domain